MPNATVMIINNAESFGLSQLHQLRGRLGRGAHKSYGILMTEARPEDEQWEKLHIVETTANGFEDVYKRQYSYYTRFSISFFQKNPE